ncbi:uncharacterized protein LOC121873374 [Homarus americanus]|uniref:uncharacterized protein LOC121873374 n=1 Tax=Homarus americanus TaxID=6706 RepID=UPI001C474320|nr:uncharacterized protein LOC121873374 [Homarus americanus]
MVNTLAKYHVFSTFDLKSAYHQLRISESDKPFTAFEANGRLYQFTHLERLKPLQELPPPTKRSALQRVLGMFAYYAKWILEFSDKAWPPYKAKSFPLDREALTAFDDLKKLLGEAALNSIDHAIPFVVECDASDVAVSATLNQAGRPVAFMFRMLSGSGDNVVPDTFTRVFCGAISSSNLAVIHEGLCHPGVVKMLHFARTKNLPFSTEDVKKVCSNCRVCAEIKPTFHRPTENTLIKATQPMDRLSINFKGPLPSHMRNSYLFIAVDEYSRFPFAIPCADMTSSTVIRCLDTIFSLCGMASFVHSDRGSAFMSREVKTHLASRGVASSKTAPYHSTGNSQIEGYNGIIWKSICLAAKSRDVLDTEWEALLPEALHSIRSLLSTAINVTPHERVHSCQGPVFLRRFVRSSKGDPLVDEVELLEANPTYAHIKYPDGRESSVSLRDLAPCSSGTLFLDISAGSTSPSVEPETLDNGEEVAEEGDTGTTLLNPSIMQELPLRRSTRQRREPQRYGYNV